MSPSYDLLLHDFCLQNLVFEYLQLCYIILYCYNYNCIILISDPIRLKTYVRKIILVSNIDKYESTLFFNVSIQSRKNIKKEHTRYSLKRCKCEIHRL